MGMQIEVGSYARSAISKFSKQPAVQTAAGVLTYGALDQSANQIGSGLLNLGLEAGTRVAVLAHNCAEIVELWLGLERAALVRVVMHTHFDMQIHAAVWQCSPASPVQKIR